MVWQKPDSTWSWRLVPSPGGGTRVVTRLKATYDFDHPAAALTSIALLEFADFPMMRHLLLGLKARAEATGAVSATPEPPSPTKHSYWARPAGRRAYEAAYDASLELWPIEHESRFVETPFGATHVVVSGPQDGEPVVLIHAASLSATQWYLQAGDLGIDHRLYAVDIMGDIGLSTQTRAIHSRVDATEWLASVFDGLGIEFAVVVGSSFGGFQATNLAVARPDLVRALVLLAPAATVRPFRLLANLAIRAGNLVPLPISVRPGLRGMMSGTLPDERIVRQMETGVAGFRYDHRGIFPSELSDTDLSAITCPTLLLVGDQEMIYDADAAIERAMRLIPTIEAEIVPGVGHLLGMQRPDIVNARIRTFLGDRVGVLQPA